MEEMEWQVAENRRTREAERRMRRRDHEAAVRDVEEEEEDMPLPDLDADDEQDALVVAGKGVLLHDHSPAAGEVVACYGDRAHRLRGHLVGAGAEKIHGTSKRIAADGFMLWVCTGEVTDGGDGIKYLHGHHVLGTQRIVEQHADNQPLEVNKDTAQPAQHPPQPGQYTPCLIQDTPSRIQDTP